MSIDKPWVEVTASGSFVPENIISQYFSTSGLNYNITDTFIFGKCNVHKMLNYSKHLYFSISKHIWPYMNFVRFVLIFISTLFNFILVLALQHSS